MSCYQFIRFAAPFEDRCCPRSYFQAIRWSGTISAVWAVPFIISQMRSATRSAATITTGSKFNEYKRHIYSDLGVASEF